MEGIVNEVVHIFFASRFSYYLSSVIYYEVFIWASGPLAH